MKENFTFQGTGRKTGYSNHTHNRSRLYPRPLFQRLSPIIKVKANVAPNDMAVILFLPAHQCHLPNKRTAYWLWSASEAR